MVPRTRRMDAPGCSRAHGRAERERTLVLEWADIKKAEHLLGLLKYGAQDQAHGCARMLESAWTRGELEDLGPRVGRHKKSRAFARPSEVWCPGPGAWMRQDARERMDARRARGPWSSSGQT